MLFHLLLPLINTRFMSLFWKNVWLRMGPSLKFNSLLIPSDRWTNRSCERNRTSGSMLRTQVKRFGKRDVVFPKIEFEFNCLKNWSISYSLFETLLGANPHGSLDLILRPALQTVSTKVEAWIDKINSLHLQAI